MRKIGLCVFLGLVIISCTSVKNKQGDFTKENVLESISKVNTKWQNEHDVTKQNAFWHNSAYHIGNLEVYKLNSNEKYLNYTLNWAENNEWKGAKSDNRDDWKFSYGETDEYVLFGDWQACFQVYIDLYQLNPDENKIARAREVMQYQVNTEEDKYWWWIDGLYMVMPVMPRMYELTQDRIYLEKLYQYSGYTLKELFDKESGLLYRDAKYVYPKHTTNNGKKDFWARGNGWVFAAMARTLDHLPESDKHYNTYLDVFIKMAHALKESQQEEGYWTRSILDPEQAPGPETSGTAFFTYGMLWGVNKSVLDEETYGPVAEKGWKYLSETAIQSDSTLGYVQPIGENAMPGQIVDKNSTSDFGVGAFLLAASEMVRYIGE